MTFLGPRETKKRRISQEIAGDVVCPVLGDLTKAVSRK